MRFTTLTSYGSERFTAEAGCLIAFPPAVIETTLAKEIAGLTPAHIARDRKVSTCNIFPQWWVENRTKVKTYILRGRKDVQTHDEALPKCEQSNCRQSY